MNASTGNRGSPMSADLPFPNPVPHTAPADANPRLRLEEEARRVAGSMAELRNRCLNGLHGPDHAPEARPRPAGGGSGPRPRGPLGFSPFYYLPFLFADAFPGLSRDRLRTLCLSNRILLEAILIQDRQIDESRPWSPEQLYLVSAYHHRAMELLLPLLPPEDPFWPGAERCFQRYARAVLREQFRRRHRLSPYGQREFAALAAGKVALIQTTPRAMAALSGSRRFLSALLRSQTLFLVGFQAFDDLKDWKEDLANRNFTHLLTRVLAEEELAGRAARGDIPAPQEVGGVLYGRGFAAEQLRSAERLFERALRLARDAPVPLWREVLRGFARNCREMRNDFDEIRRRAASGGARTNAPPRRTPAPAESRHAAAAPVRAALSFLEGRQEAGGGFRPVRAAGAYLQPATALAPSRCVTRLIQRSLLPLRDLHPPLRRLLHAAEAFVGAPLDPASGPGGLPPYFERAFLAPAPTPRARRPSRRHAPPGPPGDRFPGLAWTQQLYRAAAAGARAPDLEALAGRAVLSGDRAAWCRGTAPAPGHGPEGEPAGCRPHLPLFLLLQAPGPGLFRPPLLRRLREELSAGLRNSGGWGDPTETALRMLCLLCAGSAAEEVASGRDRLLCLQEADGSWAPNAFCKQGEHCFGSRELTTAWCLLALFLSAPGPAPAPASAPRTDGGPALPAVRLHEGLPGPLRAAACRVLGRLASLLPMPGSVQLTVGAWPSMPAHFLVPRDRALLAGVNLSSPPAPPFRSRAGRPLPVETVLALVLAARVRLRGPVLDRLERVYVLGLGLFACRLLWPGRPQHADYLWSGIRAFLTHPSPRQGPFRWLFPSPAPHRQGPIPAGAPLYVGSELFPAPGRAGAGPPAGLADLLSAPREEILRAFRVRTGAEPQRPVRTWRSFHETRAP